MNYYKNTRPAGFQQNNKGFFSIEQLAASTVMVVAGVIFFLGTGIAGESKQLTWYHASLAAPHSLWLIAIAVGIAYGILAVFSVFIFMFKGRTATFAGLVNRLTSLVAGTASTVLFWALYNGKAPTTVDWVSLAFIFIAVGFLTRAERKRTQELIVAHEISATAKAGPMMPIKVKA